MIWASRSKKHGDFHPHAFCFANPRNLGDLAVRADYDYKARKVFLARRSHRI